MLSPGSFYAEVVGTTGAFRAPGTAPAPAQNPYNPGQIGGTCTPGRTSAGLYTLTFANALPTSEYKYSAGLLGAAVAGGGSVTIGVSANVVTVSTQLLAVATDENFWIHIEPIAS